MEKRASNVKIGMNILAVGLASTLLFAAYGTAPREGTRLSMPKAEYTEVDSQYSPESTSTEQSDFSRRQISELEEVWETENAEPKRATALELSLDSKAIQNAIDYYGHGKSKITAEDIIESSKRTGIPELIYVVGLAQEGNFATRGRAVKTKNPGNVGNTDDGTNNYLSSIQKGLDLYGRTLAREYFPGKNPSLGEFMATDFRRAKDGARYMSNSKSNEEYAKIFKKVIQIARRSS